uniref:Uncharacterized protein n=1 Tax=Callorhinchus milii TaxID=7868 RepID=A0A4W3GWJ0_CALMI
MMAEDKPLDYGVQIRFIDDLKDPNKSRQKNKVTKPNSYGVMVRVQGISGQPFVVLNNSDGQAGVPGGPGRGDHPDSLSSDEPENPYDLAPRQVHSDSSYSSSDEEPSSSTADMSVTPLDPTVIDTKPLSSVDSLISKFDTRGGPLRGRPVRRSRLSSDEKRRSQSLDNQSREQAAGESCREEVLRLQRGPGRLACQLHASCQAVGH